MGTTTMADFPPNPEDGELWLPSDVFHEIVSATNGPDKSDFHQAFIKNAALDHVAIQRKSSAIKQQACGSFHGSMPNGNVAAALAVPAFYHCCAFWPDSGYLPFPGHILLYNPMISPTQPQEFEKAGGKQKSRRSSREEVKKSFAGKTGGGTGVFLPRSIDASYKEPQQTVNSSKTKKSGKKGEGIGKKWVDEIKGTLKKQEESQISNEFGLPREWTY